MIWHLVKPAFPVQKSEDAGYFNTAIGDVSFPAEPFEQNARILFV